MLQGLRVDPGRPAQLAVRDPGDRLGVEKAEGAARLQELVERLGVFQERLYAEHRRAVLLVLQGMDASGKDGTIRRVFTGVNPLGCHIVSFKAPSDLEAEHDFLWRIHAEMPRRGYLGAFNRSHYEDIVTASVIGVIDPARRARRIRHVREFERALHDEGTTILKVFLHLSKQEQRTRLQARLDDPAKRWKFRPEDLETRRRWDEYMERYDEAITATSTRWAPWYVVPADKKWVSALAVGQLLMDTLEGLDPQVPQPEIDLRTAVID